ncbi:hypothetical protein FACS1894160_3040 [Bacteroidia bacterium]|nr:hypothetical protein FACS1894160_3040 [Bacteroidia bacterium]
MQIKKGLRIKDIAGERVLIMQGHAGVDMTKVVSLNTTAEWLWNQLSDREFMPEDVSNLLTERFDLDDATAQKDAQKWIDSLLACNALEI